MQGSRTLRTRRKTNANRFEVCEVHRNPPTPKGYKISFILLSILDFG